MTFRILRNICMAIALVGLAACTSTPNQTPLAVMANTTDIPESANAVPATDAQPATQLVAAPQATTQQSTAEQTPAIGFAEPDAKPAASEPEVQIASLDTSKTVSFLPVEGAPQSAASQLSSSITQASQSNGLAILPANKSGAKYRVKGYFSAFNDGSGTLMVYVWDVLDTSGKRVHRINGRERSGKSSSDPWQSLGEPQISAMASSTTKKLKTWIDSKG